MLAKFEEPSTNEGIDEVIYVWKTIKTDS
jgi:hypothetical protein